MKIIQHTLILEGVLKFQHLLLLLAYKIDQKHLTLDIQLPVAFNSGSCDVRCLPIPYKCDISQYLQDPFDRLRIFRFPWRHNLTDTPTRIETTFWSIRTSMKSQSCANITPEILILMWSVWQYE